MRHKEQSVAPNTGRILCFAGMTAACNLLLGVFKVISGVLTCSIFACVNGFYTLGMVLARGCALAGALQGKAFPQQYRCYRRAGRVLIAASGLYIAYSIQIYFHPQYTAYHPYIAMGIAAVTFTEIGLNLRGVLMFRRGRAPLLHALKTINLAASLISLVLVQAAILSFADEEQNPEANGILGALMGGCSVLLGVYMLLRMRRITDPADCRREQKVLNRMMKKRFPGYSLTALHKDFSGNGEEIVYVRPIPGMEPLIWEKICTETARQGFQLRIEKTEQEAEEYGPNSCGG